MAVPLLGGFPSNKALVVVDTHANRIASAAMTAGQIWKESDTGLLYLYDGSAWVVWKGQGHIVKTADQTLTQSSTALQNVTDLVIPVEPNERWFVKAWLLCQGASATADWKFGWSTTATGTTANWGLLSAANTSSGSGWLGMTTATTPTALRSISQVGNTGGMNGILGIALMGQFLVSTTAGNIQLQAAQDTATAENNTILAGSFLELARLA